MLRETLPLAQRLITGLNSLYSDFKDPDFLHRRKTFLIIPDFFRLSTKKMKKFILSNKIPCFFFKTKKNKSKKLLFFRLRDYYVLKKKEFQIKYFFYIY